MRNTIRKNAVTLAAVILAAAFLLAVCLFDWSSINSYQAYNTTSTSYVRAQVTDITSETLEKDELDDQLWLGRQNLKVRLLEGKNKGEIVEITNYLTKVHSIRVEQGSRIIVCADMPENASPYYTVFGYDRTLPLWLLIMTFSAAVILIGRQKGFRALLGVAYSLLLVIMFMAQAIYHGFSPVVIALLTVLIASGVSTLLLNGFSRRTAAGLISTLTGVAVTGLIFAFFSWLLHLTGYNLDAAEQLLMVRSSTGLSLRWLLLAGVLISALGAVMDVAVSLTAAMEELVTVNPSLSGKALFRSGLHIGEDMIGTMSNTLILAYAGSSLDTMLCLIVYGYQLNQLLSSDYLAIELSQGLCATLGVVLTIPVTAAVCVILFIRKNASAKKEASASLR